MYSDKEIIINKTVTIQGIDVKLISMSLEDDGKVLWVIYKSPNNFNIKIDNKRERAQYISNREKIISGINEERDFVNIDISEVIIQNHKMTISSSTLMPLSTLKHERYNKMLSFIENGFIPRNLDDSDSENIIIVECKLKESDGFPKVDSKKKLDITLHIRNKFRNILINQSMHMKFGEMEKDNKFYFYDSIEKRMYNFYINKIYSYDVWKEVNINLENEPRQAIPNEQVKKVKQEYINELEKICPKEMNLAMLEYETEENVKLNFYSKEYLDERAVDRNSMSAIFFKSDKEVGKNGFKSRVCMIKVVEKDFNGVIDIELLSGVIRITKEIIIV